MKKTILIFGLILTWVATLSFRSTTETDEIRITVTADRKTEFDMFQDSKVIKGLMTPYEIKTTTTDSRFIFRSKELKSSLNIKVEKGGKTRLTADWPITVVLIDKDKLTTFGID